MKTGSLSLTNGAGVSASTFGKGDAGNVRVSANTIALDGTTPNQAPSGIFSQVSDIGSGRGGDVTVETGSLTVTNGAGVSASTFGKGDAGNVRVSANTIALDGTTPDGQNISGIVSEVSGTGSGRGGDVTVETDFLTVTNGAGVSASTFGKGDAGNVRVSANTIALDSTTLDGQKSSGIVSEVSDTGNGRGGNITVKTDFLSLTNGATVSASTFGKGDAGNVRVSANMIALDGTTPDGQAASGIVSQVSDTAKGRGGNVTVETSSLTVTNGATVSASTFGKGDAGNVRVSANTIALDGTTPNQAPSGIFSQVSDIGSGRGGDVTVETGSLTVTNGAVVSANTFGKGDAGNVRVTANTIALDGTPSGIGSQVSDTGNGRGGDVTVETGSLTVTNGAVVSASTFGNGDAGNVRVTANTIALDGTTPNGQPSGIGSQVAPTGIGRGGDVTIQTDSLTVTSGATVSSSAFGNGSAGNLDITARNIRLDRGFITATSVSGDGANITLNVRDLLLLRYGSQISTTAGSEQFGGNGGNITINAPKGFIVGVKGENSDITANAFTGSGGRVNITTQGIYGLQFRPRLTEFSDITASSTFGVSGVVAINTLGIDPSRGLQQLPVALVDPSNRIDQKCAAGSGFRRSSFTVTGRGGLPENPLDSLQSGEGVASWVEVKAEGNGQRAAGNREIGEGREGRKEGKDPIIEANGWIVDKNGSIVLVAGSMVENQASWQGLPTCLSDQ